MFFPSIEIRTVIDLWPKQSLFIYVMFMLCLCYVYVMFMLCYVMLYYVMFML